MRKALLSGERVEMNLCGDKSQKRMLEVVKELGQGASCIAYQAKCVLNNGSDINVILKECFPSEMSRLGCGNIEWNSDSKREVALERFSNSCKVQCDLMNDEKNINSMTHLIDGIYEANETLYSITDLNHMQTYDKISECSLSDIFTTVLSIAKAVKNYHMNGYLHLDIKPGNILAFNETRELIKLLDFDSVVLKNDVANHDIALSYSYDYASPEQRQGCREKICEATDIYAIGAICFDKIMGRTPEPSDENQFSNWDLDNNPFFIRQSNRIKRLTREFFHKTLSVQPTRRFQSISEMETLLEELISTSKRERFLNSTCPVSANEFIGRKAELEQIHESYEKGAKAVFLCGMGGIGKTELALNYADKYKDEYDVIAFGKYSSSLRSLFNDSSFISIENNGSDLDISEDKNGETRNGFRKSNIGEIRNIVDEKALLIIDNFDTESDDNLDEVLALDCRILFTSRFSFEEVYSNSASIKHIDIMPLKRDEQIQMFLKMSEHDFSLDEAKILEKIIDIVQGHTLAITLLAKHYKNGIGTLKEILVDLEGEGLSTLPDINVRHKKDGGIYNAQAYDIMHSVMFMYEFSKNEEYVLSSLALFGLMKLKKKSFVELIGMEYINTVNSLIDRSLIEQREEKGCTILSMHPLYTELSINVFSPNLEKNVWLKQFCLNLARIAKEQYESPLHKGYYWYGTEIECVIFYTCCEVLENFFSKLECEEPKLFTLAVDVLYTILDGDWDQTNEHIDLINTIINSYRNINRTSISLKTQIEVESLQNAMEIERYIRCYSNGKSAEELLNFISGQENKIASFHVQDTSELLLITILPIIIATLSAIDGKDYIEGFINSSISDEIKERGLERLNRTEKLRTVFSTEIKRVLNQITKVDDEKSKAIISEYYRQVNMTENEVADAKLAQKKEKERKDISMVSKAAYGICDDNCGKDYYNILLNYSSQMKNAFSVGDLLCASKILEVFIVDEKIPQIAKFVVLGEVIRMSGFGDTIQSKQKNETCSKTQLNPIAKSIVQRCLDYGEKNWSFQGEESVLKDFCLNAYMCAWKIGDKNSCVKYACAYCSICSEMLECGEDPIGRTDYDTVFDSVGKDAKLFLANYEMECLKSEINNILSKAHQSRFTSGECKQKLRVLMKVYNSHGQDEKERECTILYDALKNAIPDSESYDFCRNNYDNETKKNYVALIHSLPFVMGELLNYISE